MPYLYALSDAHGYLTPLEEALALVDLESDRANKLICCGDYIDYGPDSCGCLYKLQRLAESYPGQVIVLMGNHEQMFLEFLNATERDIWNIEWLGSDKNFATVNSFVSMRTRERIAQSDPGEKDHDYLIRVSKIIKEDILANHADLVRWLTALPYYYQTPNQVWVHAGIDEEAEEYWMHGTSEDYFVSKYPATFGRFYKDIIAGHISTSSLASDQDFHAVFWDGANHYYIDGETAKSGVIPVLRYNTATSRYSSFTKTTDNNGSIVWTEYFIT